MEGLYYPYSENKGADQLRGYREADLRLCFRICKTPVFSRRGSNITTHKTPLLNGLKGVDVKNLNGHQGHNNGTTLHYKLTLSVLYLR